MPYRYARLLRLAEIDSLESVLGLLKRLKIRALVAWLGIGEVPGCEARHRGFLGARLGIGVSGPRQMGF